MKTEVNTAEKTRELSTSINPGPTVMYTAIKGTYENGKVILEETPPTLQKTKVVVMFLIDEEKAEANLCKGVTIGSLAGKGYAIPDDFNEPLDDLGEYK